MSIIEFEEKVKAFPEWVPEFKALYGAKWFKIDRVPYVEGYPSIAMYYADPEEFDKNIESFLDVVYKRVVDGRPFRLGESWPEEFYKPTKE